MMKFISVMIIGLLLLSSTALAAAAKVRVTATVVGDEDAERSFFVPEGLEQARIMVEEGVPEGKIERNMERFMTNNEFRCEGSCQLRMVDAPGEQLRVMTMTQARFLIFAGEATDEFIIDEDGGVHERVRNLMQLLLNLGLARQVEVES